MRLNNNITHPCAASNNLVPPQRVSLLTSLRLLISLLLLIMLNLQWLNQPLADQSSGMSLITLLVYATINTCLLSIALSGRLQVTGLLLFNLAMLDILCLNLLIQANTHQARPLSLLFILAIVGSASVLPARMSLLVAALATLSVLLQCMAQIIYQATAYEELVTAGTLGMVFFITAFAVQGLFNRASHHELLTRRQAADIIELQRLNENIVRQMRTGILVINEHGNIQLINDAAKLLLELDDETSVVVGQRIPDPLIDTWQCWHANPQQLPPAFRISPSATGIRASFTSLLSRGTRQSLVFLEDTRLISQQAQAMKLASLGRLTGSIAHEIRNPLGAISHAAQLLGEAEALSASDQHLCDIIKGQSLRVNQVIENVLALSRRAPIQARLLNLDEYLQQFIKTYHNGQNATPHISYHAADADLIIKFDPSQLDQVLTNLFDNGLRYSALATGQARLIISACREPNNQLPQLDIVDLGTGIADADLPEIFEPFYTTQSSGNGLGLYLAREICEAHQTQLSYLKTPQQRSCFRLLFAHPQKRWLA
jgi:two-component system sensor histidine kinase PilS (NtrC family)